MKAARAQSKAPGASNGRRLLTQVPRVPSAIIALLAIIPILVGATFYAISILNASFALQQNLLQAVQLNDEVLRLQLDEETGVRGFAMTGRTVLLEPYHAADKTFDRTLNALAMHAEAVNVPAAKHDIDILRFNHEAWLRRVARPILHDPAAVRYELTGKTLLDRFRDASSQLDRAIQLRASDANSRTRRTIVQLASAIIVITVIVAALVVYASQRQRRLLAQIDTEQDVIRVLQSAIVNNIQPISGTEVGTAYISATDGAAIGGDFFDVQPLDGTGGYFVVGDVSGKGVNAAVDTALIRHAVRTLFSVTQDPGEVLTRFNTTFIAARSSPDVFVVMFVGVVDAKMTVLKYASAGHPQAYLRRRAAVTQLTVTGPLLGVFSETEIATASHDLALGDVLLITTDGLTEARNANRIMLEDAGVMRWIQEADILAPQPLVDALVGRLKTYAPTMRDDLAVLAVRIGSR